VPQCTHLPHKVRTALASSDRALTPPPQVTSICTDITRICAFAYRSADFTAGVIHPDLAKREDQLGQLLEDQGDALAWVSTTQVVRMMCV
jgi:hypothetical protein